MTKTIRDRHGRIRQIPDYAPWKAIKLHCVFCFGPNPLNCTNRLCALFPYRGKTRFLKTALPRPKKAVCLPAPPLPPLHPPKTAQNRPTVSQEAS